MKKFALLLIVLLSLAIPWLAYGATEPEIPMPQRSADMYNWQDWSDEGLTRAAIILDCNDKSTIWLIHTDGDSNDYCMQVTFVPNENEVIQELDQMRSAPNCRCPASSY